MAIDQDQVKLYVGRVTQDVLAGWVAGLKGKQRLAGKLWERQAPIALVGQRQADWEDGRNGAARLLATRQTIFLGKSAAGEEIIKRKGWLSTAERWKTVKSLRETQETVGDIRVSYVQDGDIVREYQCGT